MKHERFRNRTNEWETPIEVFGVLDAEFGFTLDVCASSENRKCENYFDKERDGLRQEWRGVCWMNPPYGQQIRLWVKKAFDSSVNGARVVCLLPARTNTAYWHNYCMKAEIRFIKGYPRFGDAVQGLKFPLAVVVFRPPGANDFVANVMRSCVFPAKPLRTTTHDV